MVQKAVNQILKENQDRKISARTDLIYYNGNNKPESVEYDPELYTIDLLNLK